MLKIANMVVGGRVALVGLFTNRFCSTGVFTLAQQSPEFTENGPETRERE